MEKPDKIMANSIREFLTEMTNRITDTFNYFEQLFIGAQTILHCEFLSPTELMVVLKTPNLPEHLMLIGDGIRKLVGEDVTIIWKTKKGKNIC